MPVLINRLFHRSFRWTATSQLEQSDESLNEELQQDDDSSLLSEPEWRDYWEKPEYSTLGYFQHRERLLRRILRDNPLADQIRRRERSVRLLHYQHHTPRRVKAKQHMVMTELLVKNEEKVSFWKEFWIFEWHSSIPAAYCLLIHCFAHSAVDDFVRTFIGSSLFATMCGILLLRLSGDLYWWLDDDRYDALRVDFDNRRRLGNDIEMEWRRQIRRRPIVRAICFMIGYPLCYMVSVAFNESIERFLFNEHDYIASNLPSVLQDERNGMCPAAVSFCSTACQSYLKERGMSVARSHVHLHLTTIQSQQSPLKLKLT